MTTPTPNRRWYHLTPARFFAGLLVVQVFLLLSERFRWFWFNEHKGWTVLIAVGVVGLAVLVMLVWGVVCLCSRRRFQFGVRSLLVFLLTVSIPLGWFAWEMERARTQREAVETILEKGGEVGYDYEWDENGYWGEGRQPTTPTMLRKLLGDDFFCEVVQVDCCAWDFGDNDARHLRELTSLKWLSLDAPQLTSNGLAYLKGMTELEDLSLNQTQITDKGLTHLNGMTKLVELSLDNTQITDNGLGHLKGMTRLESLGIGGTQVTDAGLAYLKGMTDLKRLGLDGTQITDKGLGHLKGMKELNTLWLGGTQATNEGVKKLQRALPNCVIWR